MQRDQQTATGSHPGDPMVCLHITADLAHRPAVEGRGFSDRMRHTGHSHMPVSFPPGHAINPHSYSYPPDSSRRR
jgi:hypothetical protein